MSLFSRSRVSEDRGPLDRDLRTLDDRSCHPSSDNLLANRRYGLILNRHNEESFDEHLQALAWVALEKEMALVPGQDAVTVQREAANPAHVPIPSFYVDRFAVTNANYARFVADGGYSQTEYWPQEIWPNLLHFVDSTGFSGPRYWSDGKPPRGKESHPVVGVSWFEARAYALWCGKRLPTAPEWQHAGSWSHGQDGRGQNIRYPWGNTFMPERTNTWSCGPGETVAVDRFYSGCTPNGIYQLIGNVWEWVATQYQYDARTTGLRVHFEQPMAEVRGGAFDTYFETQATCQFRTGQPFLYRAPNVGFRCCLPADQLREPPSPSAFL
ncbi:MAG: formylglycine-generating enzyme family protein [Planctomycetaceae bacterium]